VRPVWRASGPRLPRRSTAHGSTLLHELRRAQVPTEGGVARL
jgi:hypothetical protein